MKLTTSRVRSAPVSALLRRGEECGVRSVSALERGLSQSAALRPAAGPAQCQSASDTSGFTMVEIALCLAIIGFALVSILLVLPSGMNTQRQTREETIINQDASVLMEAIRGGARGVDDLTNYVYAITNYVAFYDDNGVLQPPIHHWGYTYNAASYDNGSDVQAMHLSNGLKIIGLLSTPEFTDGSGPLPYYLGAPIPSLYFGGISNHVVAYIHSVSGLAAEKPPQDNQIMQEDTFSYRVLVVNAPTPIDTNSVIDLFNWPLWQSGAGYAKDRPVSFDWARWRAVSNTVAGDPAPGQPVSTNWQSSQWVEVPNYSLALARNQRELRLYFEWPQLPNGNVGVFRQNFRMSIAGQLTPTNYASFYFSINPLYFYFYEPQIFSSAP